MIVSPAFAGKSYAVLGLARSGLATVAALIASGARVVAWDEKEGARGEAAALGSDIRNPIEIDLANFTGVVVSPGVPINRHPIAAHARNSGVPLIGDVELFAQARPHLPPHKVVGITGTNGKSTTTALLYHILQVAGVPSLMGGNIGLPILSRDPLTPNAQGVGVYVLELSSYQIDLTYSLDCEVAVLLNVTPDHLDRYDGFAAYRASKLRLFEMQSAGHVGVIATADPAIAKLTAALPKGPGVWRTDASEGNALAQMSRHEWPTLQGPHNAQNAWAAYCAAAELGVPKDVRDAALRTYPGLPHRMERVGEVNGVLFVNDSKATNADSTAPALAAYPKIRWILGGQAKSADLGACEPHFGNVRSAYTIGEAGPMFAGLLGAHMPVLQAGTLDQAVAAAAHDAESGDVVLLSPACASFDQFRDFEHRGDTFRALVQGMTKEQVA